MPSSAPPSATATWCRWRPASGRRRLAACSTIRRRPSCASSTTTACSPSARSSPGARCRAAAAPTSSASWRRCASAARLATPAGAIRRGHDGVHVRDAAGHWDRFDKAILACHADQALALLTDADARERDLLGRFAYSSNEVWLHADATLMPRRRSTWSSWNYVADSEDRDSPVSVTYWMNRLQALPEGTPLFVSVNPGRTPTAALQRFTFEHPMYDAAAIRAQRTLHAIQGMRDTFFCGSYCGYGFHEDALSAGLDVAEQLGVRRPWRKPDEHRRIGAIRRAWWPMRRSAPSPCRSCRERPLPHTRPHHRRRHRGASPPAAARQCLPLSRRLSLPRPRRPGERGRTVATARPARPGVVPPRRPWRARRFGPQGLAQAHPGRARPGRDLRRRGRADDPAAHAGLRLQSGELLVLPRPLGRAARRAVRGQQHLRREPLLPGPSRRPAPRSSPTPGWKVARPSTSRPSCRSRAATASVSGWTTGRPMSM